MFYYYGAKRYLAKRYPAPMFPTVVEPFAGSAQYAVRALRLGLAERAVLYDTDERVVKIWRRLLAMTPAEVSALPDLVAGDVTSDPLHLVVAASNSWGTSKKLTVTERMPKLWRSMLWNIADSLPYLKGRVSVELGDYTLSRQSEPATYFVDPPYQPVPDPSVKTGSPRGMGYARGSNSASLDFAALADWCRSAAGQVIVCEQEGADWLPFTVLKAAQDSQGRLRNEVFWTNDCQADPYRNDQPTLDMSA